LPALALFAAAVSQVTAFAPAPIVRHSFGHSASAEDGVAAAHPMPGESIVPGMRVST